MTIRTRILAVGLTGLLALGATAPTFAQDSRPTSQADVPTMQEAGAHLQAQEWEEAAAALGAIAAAQPENAQAWHLWGYALHAQGKLHEALPKHLMATEFEATRPTAAYNIACVYAIWGKTDKAFAWLDRAEEYGFMTRSNLNHMSNDPDMDALRDDPRFKKFAMKQVAVPRPTPAVGRSAPESQPTSRPASVGVPKFLIGSWDVYLKDGTRVGESVIDSANPKRLYSTRWFGTSGNTARSVTYYHPGRKTWHQTWIDSEGVVAECAGTMKDGTLWLEGTLATKDGETTMIRLMWSQRDDGTLHQIVMSSGDEGESWTTVYDLTYKPHKEKDDVIN